MTAAHSLQRKSNIDRKFNNRSESLTAAIEKKFTVYNTLKFCANRMKFAMTTCQNKQEKTNIMSSTSRLIKTLTISLSLSTFAVLQTGCSYLEPYKSGIAQGNILTQESVTLLQEGLTKGQVRQLIGPPLGENPFDPNHWEYVFYTTGDNDNLSEVDQHLIIKFGEDGMLASWEEKPMAIQYKKEEKFLGLF